MPMENQSPDRLNVACESVVNFIFDEGEQPRIFQCRDPMTNALQILWIRGKGHKAADEPA